jgi:hypothetical protein
MDTESIRAQRQERADRKASRLLTWAKSAEKKADQERAKHSGFSNDWQFITQPILIGHHSERRHRNLHARISKQMDKEMEGVTVAGDAERKRQQNASRQTH